MNFLDRTISFFNPRAAAFRIRSRILVGELEHFAEKRAERRYDAAGSGRRTKDWRAMNTSANQETSMSLDKLRARSRDLDRNNPYAHRALGRIADNVVGTGIRPTHKVEQKKVRDAWDAWAEKTTEADFDGLLTLYGLQRLIIRTVAMSGECIVRKRRTKDNEMSGIPIQLQVFEPDILDTSKTITNVVGTNAGGFIIQGVEFDKNGRRYGYWLWDHYPNDVIVPMSLVSKFVPAADVLHIYDLERPGQVRGVPFGCSSMLRLKDFDEFEDAELVRQKIAACFSVFITESIDTTPDPNGKKTEITEKVEPGLIQRLSPGETVSFTNPPAKDNIDGYSRQVLQGIAAGYGVSYEALTGDLRNVNFSSGRMGWIEFQRQVTSWQYNMMIPMLCNKIWAWFLEGAEIGGIYGKKKKSDLLINWTAPRREMIDPQKEIMGMTAGIRSGLQSWGDAVTELGYDPDTQIEDIAKWNKKLDDLKIILDSDPRNTDAAGKAKVDEAAVAIDENTVGAKK